MNKDHSIDVLELPNYQLANLKTFSLNAFMQKGETEVAQLNLNFGVIFNDFKDMLWFLDLIVPSLQRERQKVGPNTKNAKLGQLCGMQQHCQRILAGCAWEFIQTIEKNMTVIRSPEFDTLVQCSDKNVYKAWGEIIDTIYNKRDLYKTLVEIRNNANYHYYNTNYASKGIDHYRSRIDDIGFISLGTNPEETRFYFAEAALQFYYIQASAKYAQMQDFAEQFNDFVTKSMLCLRFIINKWFITYPQITLNDYI